MIETFFLAFTIFVLYFLCTFFGMTFLPANLRTDSRKTFVFLLTPLLGAGMWVFFSISTGWFGNYNRLHIFLCLLCAAAWCFVRRKNLFLPVGKQIYFILTLLFLFSVFLGRLAYPVEINGGTCFSFAVYDHVRCAIVNAIAVFGIPPVNPWLADHGIPVPMFYYFGWYAWAAQIPMVIPKISALFAQSALIGTSSLLIISGLSGIAGLCGLARKSSGIWLFLFSLLFTLDSSILLNRFLPESWLAVFIPEEYVGFWTHTNNFVWSPHHMFSGGLVVLIIYLYFLLCESEDKKVQVKLALLLGCLASASAMTSVYAGLIALVYMALSAGILYAASKSFRLLVNRSMIAHLLFIVVFLGGSAFFLNYLFSYRTENTFLAFGMMPAYGHLTGPLIVRWIKYLISLYFFILPHNTGLCFCLGILACLIPGLLSKNHLMQFFKIFSIVTLLSITLFHNTIYSNDFSWRTYVTASFLFSLFTAFVLEKFIDWFKSGQKGRQLFGCSIFALLIAIEIALIPHLFERIGFRKNYPEMRVQFNRAVKGWENVHRLTEERDMVLCNPKSFYELGVPYETGEYSTNVFFSLYSKRATPIGDLIFSKCYAEYYPQQKIQERYERVCRFFEGNPIEEEANYLADDLKVKAILVTPYDGLWRNPGAIQSRFDLINAAENCSDFKIYLRRNPGM